MMPASNNSSLLAFLLLLVAGSVTATPCLKLVSIGDWGTTDFSKSGLNLRADSITAANGLPSCPYLPPAILLLGDNFYADGPYNSTDPQWNNLYVKQFNLTNLWSIPHYVIAGNHDWYSQPGYPAGNLGDKKGPKFLGVVSELSWGSTLEGQGTPWTFPSLNYTRTFTQNGVTVFVAFIDTWTMSNGSYSQSGESGVWKDVNGQVPWLASVLASEEATSADWRIVVGHYDVRSTRYGVPSTNVYLAHLEPLFLQNNVNAYFCGHYHQLQIIQTAGGVNGLTYYVNGAGGKQDTGGDINTPGLQIATNIVETTQAPSGPPVAPTYHFGFMSHVFTKTSMTTTLHQPNPADDIVYVQGITSSPSTSPTLKPTTLSPTVSPTNSAPSVSPTSSAPSGSPTTSLPTSQPTIAAPVHTHPPTRNHTDDGTIAVGIAVGGAIGACSVLGVVTASAFFLRRRERRASQRLAAIRNSVVATNSIQAANPAFGV